MGLMVDTNVFISFEKSGKPTDFSSWEIRRRTISRNSPESRDST